MQMVPRTLSRMLYDFADIRLAASAHFAQDPLVHPDQGGDSDILPEDALKRYEKDASGFLIILASN